MPDHKASKAATAAPTVRMRAALAQLLDEVGNARFRRQDLAAKIYPLTNPRDRKRADAVATVLMQEMAKQGKLIRDGQVHWRKVVAARTLSSGRTVAEHDPPITLQLTTRAPDKWVAVDLETGEAWLGNPGGWERAPASAVTEACDVLRASAPRSKGGRE
jgi:hypothetical protein